MVILIVLGGIVVLGSVFVLQCCLKAAAAADEHMDRLMGEEI